MSFQSLEFAVFLLLTLCVFYTVPAKLRLWVLLVADAVFFLWADITAGVWLFFSVLTTWIGGLWIAGTGRRNVRRMILVLCLVVNLGLLAVFQYFPVWNNLINRVFGHGMAVVHLDVAKSLGLVAPIGISFYTLQAAGYLMDVYAGANAGASADAPEKNLARYAVFVSFFPNLMSGPIERGHHFLSQLDEVLTKSRRELLCYDRMMQGMVSVIWGLYMKLVIADRTAILVDYVYGMYQNGDSFTLLVCALFYSIQIYCDFAGYSCIAVGVGRLFGFELIRNFRQPYFATGISDFWKRWHISLSSWLRDYVYIPLGGNRKGLLRKYLNLLLVFLVSGIWHGGDLPFLVWGVLYGIFSILEDICHRIKKKSSIRGRDVEDKRSLWAGGIAAGKRVLAAVVTFLIVTCLWIVFRCDSLEMVKACFVNLFTRWQGFLYIREFIFVMGLDKTEFCIAAAAIFFLGAIDLVSEIKKEEASVWIHKSPLAIRWGLVLVMLVSIFVFGMYGPGYDASSYIYVNF